MQRQDKFDSYSKVDSIAGGTAYIGKNQGIMGTQVAGIGMSTNVAVMNCGITGGTCAITIIHKALETRIYPIQIQYMSTIAANNVFQKLN